METNQRKFFHWRHSVILVRNKLEEISVTKLVNHLVDFKIHCCFVNENKIVINKSFKSRVCTCFKSLSCYELFWLYFTFHIRNYKLNSLPWAMKVRKTFTLFQLPYEELSIDILGWSYRAWCWNYVVSAWFFRFRCAIRVFLYRKRHPNNNPGRRNTVKNFFSNVTCNPR